MNLTKETLDRLYKKQKTMLSAGWIVTIAVIVISEMIRITVSGTDMDTPALDLIILAIDILPFIYIGYTMKTIIPAGNMGNVRKAFKLLKNDFASDNAENTLYRFLGQTSKYPEKIRLTLLLADTLTIRGKVNEALQLLYSADRSGFEKYPDIGMSFYGEIIDIYSAIGDNDSVLRAYEDGKSFTERVGEKNYNCCITAFEIMINVEKARGNYRKALDLRLIKNEYENLFNSTTGASVQGAPLSIFLKGCIFMDSAELFYLCGDLENAAKYLDIGGPMLSASVFYTNKANELSEKVRAAFSQR